MLRGACLPVCVQKAELQLHGLVRKHLLRLSGFGQLPSRKGGCF